MPFFIPLPQTKKGLIITLAILSAAFLILAVFSYFNWSNEQRILQDKGRPDFTTLAENQLEAGMYVHGDIIFAMDVYAVAYESTGFRSSQEITGLYYLIPIYDKTGHNIQYLITYNAGPEDFDAMEKIVAQSWSNDPLTTQLTVENGYISPLPTHIQKYFLEWAHDESFYDNGSFIDWCKEYNIFGTDDEAAIEAKLVPFNIYRTDRTVSSQPLITWVFGGLGVLVLIGMILVIRYKHPIKGFEDTPSKDDFSALKELDEA